MNFYVEGHNYINDVQTTIQIFFPNESYNQIHFGTEKTFISSIYKNNEVTSAFFKDGKLMYLVKTNKVKNVSLDVRKGIYLVLSNALGKENPWGILTGIRPTKVIGNLKNNNHTIDEIYRYMSKECFVKDDKIDLCFKVYNEEEKIVKGNNGNDTSLYIGIPFCPTRCLYCSFTSYPIDKYKHRVKEYLNALEKEMEFVKNILVSPKFLENIYIGGGTPTALDEFELYDLINRVNNYFDTKSLREYTVEAGRPDTITKEKLKLLRDAGVTRISINPQTIHDKTLKIIGRNHTTKDFLKAFYLARKEGFRNINIDLILGLPGENVSDVRETFRVISDLNPDNVTVHTLSVKRASRLNEDLSTYTSDTLCDMDSCISSSKYWMKRMELKPYYMYRQKNMLGNYENVGYAKEGMEGVYNIQMMKERQSVYAIGAGATTKIVDLKTDHIERIFNVKNVDEYIDRIDEMIERKRILKG